MIDKLPLWVAALIALVGLGIGLVIWVVLKSIKGSSGTG